MGACLLLSFQSDIIHDYHMPEGRYLHLLPPEEALTEAEPLNLGLLLGVAAASQDNQGDASLFIPILHISDCLFVCLSQEVCPLL